jgi:signal peptidase I
VSERWDAGPNGADDRDGWGSGRTAAPSSRSSLRRHSQPRDSGDRIPGLHDDPGFPDPAFPEPGFRETLGAALPTDGDSPGQGRLPGGRRPDPSSYDPGLTALSGPLAPDDPRSPLFVGPPLDLDLQPGSRLRVGPRHGAGERSDSERAPKTPLRAAVGAVTEVAVVLGMALLLSLLIKTFLVQAFFIPSPSMENTLLVGDRVLVSKLTPGIFDLHRGDVVVFKDPGGWLGAEQVTPLDTDEGLGGTVRRTLSFVGLLPQDAGEHLIKRVIGMGGDHVVCCDANGRITVNGAAVGETPYLVPGAAASDKKFDVVVPRGYLWVMGDNRPVSADSRLHRKLNNGMVPVHDVVGKAFVIVWPFDRAGGLGVPASVFGSVPDPPSQ